MNLYLISQTERTGYDTYDSAVVAASSPARARRISPRESDKKPLPAKSAWPARVTGAWASRVGNVTAEFIGTATPETKTGLILASFNAG